MKFQTALNFVSSIVLVTITGTASAGVSTITLDGVLNGNDNYSTEESVSWYQGHQSNNSIYGDFNNQLGTTKIRYGTGTLAGETGVQYFFLHVHAPLAAKNMIWENRDWSGGPIANTDPNAGLTEDDVSSYRTHHETHHNPFTMNLDFNGATGSEKLIFVDDDGDEVFEADLAGNADNMFGLLGFKDSVDFLFDNNLATENLSLARHRTMSFEFMFELDATKNDALLDLVRNGIEFHLSPERGIPVPTPGSAMLLGLGGIAAMRRRR